MSILYEAEGIQKKIESHSHWGPCLNGWRYDNFKERRSALSTCMRYNKELAELKEGIISKFNELQLKKKIYNQSIIIQDKEYEQTSNKFKTKENNKQKRNDNLLESFEDDWKKKLFEEDRIIEQIKADIIYLKENIKELNKKLEIETDYKKDEYLNSLKNEYDYKLLEYENRREMLQMKREAEIRKMKREIESKKEIELYELKVKAEFIQNLIRKIKIINKIY